MQAIETASTFDLPDERVWVVGDLHGNARWIQSLLPAMRRFDPTIRTILQLGDYGFDHSNSGTHPIDYWAKKTGIERVLVTLGNHEEWNHVAPAQDEAPGEAIRVSEAVWLLPRPFRFKIAGRKVLSLGGASSVDKALRTAGKDWFEDELITESMETAAISSGPADLLLTHEAPVRAAPEVLAILARNDSDYPSDALSVSAAQRERVQRVSDAVRPALHLHGHMHTFGTAGIGEHNHVVSLHRDTFSGNAGILHLGSMMFEPLPAPSGANSRPAVPGRGIPETGGVGEPRHHDVPQAMAVIEKGQQLAGHFPSSCALRRAQRILTGELSPAEAEREMNAALKRVVERERSNDDTDA